MRSPPAPLPARRLFAHLLQVDIACPNCGRLHAAQRTDQRRRVYRRPGKRQGGYDQLTGIFRCRTCERRYLLGVVAYPLTQGRPRRPSDTRPTLAEAAQLRVDASWAAQEPLGEAYANIRGVDEVEGDDLEAGGRGEGGKGDQ